MGTDYSTMAKLLASPARSAVVDALMEGRPLTSGELARIAGVRASTISEHLAELLDGGLVAVIKAGRHRYYRLSNAEVAEALEAFSRICPATPVRSLRQSTADHSLRLARLCYDHVAGALGVALLDRMRCAGWLVSGVGADFEVTEPGIRALAEIGIDLERCRQARRHFARSCLDWSERRQHLAGALGAAITRTLLDMEWLRRAGTGRGLQVTSQGELGLRRTFSVGIPELSSDHDPAVPSR
ncbi:MAG TPA: winged helix-turn-helix domain-containing protein [Streptosporangiaceae bacterium]|nr:winged helix-turn-helix domain-containing protein [Streptosporangiaceae bacterium]